MIDIGRAYVNSGTRLVERRRLQDLMRICYKLNWPDRELFIAQYAQHMGKPFSPLWRLPMRYYDLKQGLKKAIRGKRKKRSRG